jgi:hypothetical protein
MNHPQYVTNEIPYSIVQVLMASVVGRVVEEEALVVLEEALVVAAAVVLVGIHPALLDSGVIGIIQIMMLLLIPLHHYVNRGHLDHRGHLVERRHDQHDHPRYVLLLVQEYMTILLMTITTTTMIGLLIMEVWYGVLVIHTNVD